MEMELQQRVALLAESVRAARRYVDLDGVTVVDDVVGLARPGDLQRRKLRLDRPGNVDRRSLRAGRADLAGGIDVTPVVGSVAPS